MSDVLIPKPLSRCDSPSPSASLSSSESLSARAVPRLHGNALFRAAHTPIIVSRHLLRESHASHDHDFMEVVLITGGRGRHLSLHGEQAIGAGDAFILRAGAWHAYRDCRDLKVINCCFGSELLARELAFLRDEPALNYLLWSGPMSLERRGIVALTLRGEGLRQSEKRLRNLEKATAREAFSHGERIAHLVLLLSHLARHLGKEYRQALERSHGVHPAVLTAIRVLESQAERAWTLSEVASEVHLDRFYLSRLFKAHTGLAPLEYLSRLRLERAASLLLRSDAAVVEIARQVGCENPNYFARRFKAHFGQSAREYRRDFSQKDGK